MFRVNKNLECKFLGVGRNIRLTRPPRDYLLPQTDGLYEETISLGFKIESTIFIMSSMLIIPSPLKSAQSLARGHPECRTACRWMFAAYPGAIAKRAPEPAQPKECGTKTPPASQRHLSARRRQQARRHPQRQTSLHNSR